MNHSRIEAAWAEMADGLQVQRYFLEVRPAYAKRADGLLASRWSGREDGLAALRERHGDPLLEQALHPSQPSPLAAPVASVRLAGRPVHVGPAIAGASDPPLVDVARLTGGISEQQASAMTRALETVGLEFLVALHLRIVALVDEAPPADRFGPDPRLVGTVALRAGDASLAWAEDLAARCSAQWLIGFMLARPVQVEPPPRVWSSPWGDLGTLDLAGEILAKSVRLRFRERLAEKGVHPPARAESLRDELLTQVEFVQELDSHLTGDADVPWYNNMDILDIVTTLGPWPHRFDSYARGGGAGQAE